MNFTAFNQIEQDVLRVTLSRGHGVMCKSKKHAQEEYPNLTKNKLVYITTTGGTTVIRLTDAGEEFIKDKPWE